MNAPVESTTPTIPGTPYAGGFFVFRILIDAVLHALILAPKAERTLPAARWNRNYDNVPGALSYNDGLANTKAMAEAGSELAKAALAKEIDGHADWYIPAVDELEMVYRHFKPGTEKNYCWARSGINQAAIPPTAPYTPDHPGQTAIEDFRAGGPEAIDVNIYWASTQDAADSYWAWGQDFGDGGQDHWDKGNEFPALLVRREPIR